MKTEMVLSALAAVLTVFATGACFATEQTGHVVHRHALVIGNSAYSGSPWGKLNSPAKDARDVANLLGNKDFGYTVRMVIDADADVLKASIKRFIASIDNLKADIIERRATKSESVVVIFYWSGHGFSRDRGSLFLAATDAVGKHVEDVMARSEDFGAVIEKTTSDDNIEFLSFAFVDACRTTLSLPSRYKDRTKGGQAKGNVLTDATGSGAMILYGSRGGRPSIDGANSNQNSLFTNAFLAVARKSSDSTGMFEFASKVASETKRLSVEEGFKPPQEPRIEGDPTTELRLKKGSGQNLRTQLRTDNVIVVADASGGLPMILAQAPVQSQPAAPASAPGEARSGAEATSVRARALKGWIWAGNYTGGPSPSEPPGVWTRATLLEASEFVEKRPSDLTPGQKLEAGANLFVRAEFPALGRCNSSNYASCYEAKGVIDRGSTVVVLEKPRIVTAGKNRQVWIKVEEVATPKLDSVKKD